jgi:protocatechuate 3,4-dioxygenase beta subunit
MDRITDTDLTRRRFLGVGIAAAVGLPALVAACGGDDPAASSAPPTDATTTSTSGSVAETPSCADADETISETEGPFFESGSPERTSFREDGVDGTPLTVTGIVQSTGCEPLAGAKLDFWHADPNGAYDVEGYRLRGHQFTDAAGRYRLETIVPAPYGPRTRHIHVKVQREGGRVLTTQLYFPGEPKNDDDDLFHGELLMDIRDDGEGRAGTFDFVLA